MGKVETSTRASYAALRLSLQSTKLGIETPYD
jgi:hypothetical protein